MLRLFYYLYPENGYYVFSLPISASPILGKASKDEPSLIHFASSSLQINVQSPQSLPQLDIKPPSTSVM